MFDHSIQLLNATIIMLILVWQPHYFSSQLQEERVRQWELRQLRNIEEATTHELTIEYI